MYFKNISNEELRQFHPVNTQDFIMSLTDVLDSNLFKIENHDGIYRIFPLFYCNSIKSNNPTDNILENRCIIASKMSEETYFTFSTGESSDLPVIPSSFLNDTFKGLDTDLTTGEYNKFVYMVRENYPFNDTIRLNKLVTGEYGTYHFRSVTDDMGTILDNGILLSDSLKQNGLQVMLSDPVFHYSRYMLHLKIYDFGDGDIPFDGDLTNATVTDLSVELVNGEYVDIPLTGEYRYAVISLDATIEIIHDKPILPDTVMSIDLTANPTIIQTGEHSEMYATCYDNGCMPVGEGHTVHFFEKIEPSLTVSASQSIIQTSETTELYAKVKDADGSLAVDVPVHFYKPNEIVKIDTWTETGYQTDYYYPAPITITGEMKANGSWGGLRVYGDDNDHHYVYLGQGNATNDENAKVFYKIGTNWTPFKIRITNNYVLLYINNVLRDTVQTDISKPLSVWGGSSANKVSVRNVVIE